DGGSEDELHGAGGVGCEDNAAGIAAGEDAEVSGDGGVLYLQGLAAVVGESDGLRQRGLADAGGGEVERKEGRERNAGRRCAYAAECDGLGAVLVGESEAAGFGAEALRLEHDVDGAGGVRIEGVAAGVGDGEVS